MMYLCLRLVWHTGGNSVFTASIPERIGRRLAGLGSLRRLSNAEYTKISIPKFYRHGNLYEGQDN